MPARQQTEALPEQFKDADEFLGLLGGEVGAGPTKRPLVEKAVRALAQEALRDTVVLSDDVTRTVKAMIAEIDARLTKQVNLILHNERFQQLESAWRGLHYLVNNTETDTMLQIKVLNVSKAEVSKNLEKFRGTGWDQSPLFKKVYAAEFGTMGGNPYGCLVGDFYFDHSPSDVELLGDLAKIGAAAHAPFLTAAAPSLMRMESWQELSNPRDIKGIFKTDDYAAWRSLRASEDSRYLGLAMPRFLARLPYGAKTRPVEEFAFEEETAGGDHSKYTWANAAYAMAVNVTRSFKSFGWCTSIRGYETGGIVQGLPMHTFPSDDGGVDSKCPTEIAIEDRRENELADCGLMPMIHNKGSDEGVFISAQSLQQPQIYNTAEASANSRLSARLPYLFATCRFAHYLKRMVRKKIGSSAPRAKIETDLSNWIKDYVLGNPEDAGDTLRAQKPLAEAEVVLEDVEGNPGWYTAKFKLKPHYQLEGMDISLSLVSRIERGG
jgi:type VI secretion system protein ImpC